jgi:hypothetical protein
MVMQKAIEIGIAVRAGCALYLKGVIATGGARNECTVCVLVYIGIVVVSWAAFTSTEGGQSAFLMLGLNSSARVSRKMQTN